MDLTKPVSNYMTTKLITAECRDNLRVINELFQKNRIHHIPVVKFRGIKGLISKSDFLHFKRGMAQSKYEENLEDNRLDHYFAEDIMTRDLVTIAPDDRMSLALEILKENLFHALPVTQNEELVGIITTFDFLKLISTTE